MPTARFGNAALGQFCHHIDLCEQALDFCINARAVRQRGLHQAAVLKDAVLAVDNGVEGSNEPHFNGFLVQMRSFAFVFTLEFAVALPDDPAIFRGRVPDFRAEVGTTVTADDS